MTSRAHRRPTRHLAPLTLAELVEPLGGARELVLAVTGIAHARATVDRAARIARSLGHALEVVGAVDDLPDANRFADQVEGVMTSTATLHVLRGSVTEVAIARALERRPVLVVVSPEAPAGRSATTIAMATDTPVLVARTPRPDGPVLAATKMANLGYPVLAAATRVGRNFVGRTVFVHTAAPSSTPEIEGITQLACDAKLARLKTLAHRTPLDAEAVLVRSKDVTTAIVGAAARYDADLLFVGARRRSVPSIAESAIDRTSCSVVVVPVDAT